MKLLFHKPLHSKNAAGIVKMCEAVGVECELTSSDARLFRYDYDILVANASYVDPRIVPPHVKIVYGPQHWVFPSGPHTVADDVLSRRAVYNSLSPWNAEVLASLGLKIPIVQFPFSVDVDRFKPLPMKTFDCIVYYKNRPKALLDAVTDVLRAAGLRMMVYTYGTYQEHYFLHDLQHCKFMVVLDAHESQGFALQEAMACNVPLLVLDASTMHDEQPASGPPTYAATMAEHPLTATSVPYWSEECGIRIRTVEEFAPALERMRGEWESFAPRNYVLRTLSPFACGTRILKGLDLPLPPRVTLVSGASQNHFKSLKQLAATALPHVDDLVLYDLGLDAASVAELQTKFRGASVRRFDFGAWPDWYDIRVEAGQWAWKSAILAEVSAAAAAAADPRPHILLWCDAGNYVNDLKALRAWTAANRVYSPVSEGNGHWLMHPSTVSYFLAQGGPVDLSRRNRNGATLAFRIDDADVRALVDEYAAACAIREFIAPPGSNRSNHRQDQSVFTLLYYKFFWAHPAYKTCDEELGIAYHKDID